MTVNREAIETATDAARTCVSQMQSIPGTLGEALFECRQGRTSLNDPVSADAADALDSEAAALFDTLRIHRDCLALSLTEEVVSYIRETLATCDRYKAIPVFGQGTVATHLEAILGHVDQFLGYPRITSRTDWPQLSTDERGERYDRLVARLKDRRFSPDEYRFGIDAERDFACSRLGDGKSKRSKQQSPKLPRNIVASRASRTHELVKREGKTFGQVGKILANEEKPKRPKPYSAESIRKAVERHEMVLANMGLGTEARSVPATLPLRDDDGATT